MDMNFPHPRHMSEPEAQTADYSVLVASATSRQAASRTVSALLTVAEGRVGENDQMSGRLDFFAANGGKPVSSACGAFWPAKFESAVNPAGSRNIKVDHTVIIRPESQVTERGTEL
jgi:hypothetical protein